MNSGHFHHIQTIGQFSSECMISATIRIDHQTYQNVNIEEPILLVKF